MVGEKLKQLRNQKGLLQKDIAKHLGITGSAYGFYEQNQRQPDLDTIKKLADFFNVSVGFLIEDDEKKAVFTAGIDEHEKLLERMTPEQRRESLNYMKYLLGKEER